MRFGEEGFEGLLPRRRLRGWWTLNELGTALVHEESGRALRLGDPIEVRRRPGRDRARAGGPLARRFILVGADGQEEKRKAAAGDVATNRQAALPLQPAREAARPASCCRARRSSRCATAAVQLKDAYAEVRDGEVWLRNMHIAPYDPAAREPRPRAPAQAAAAPARDRAADRQDGREGPDARPDPHLLQAARARRSSSRWRQGKDVHDKRRSIKDREQKREIERSERCPSGYWIN